MTIPAEQMKTVLRSNGGAWFESFGRIKLKSGDVQKPTMNAYQKEINEAHQYCVENALPCRIIGLKPRQKGSSTFFTDLLYTDVRRPIAGEKSVDACVMGGQYSQCDNLWEIISRYHEHDKFPWGNNMRITQLAATCTNGGRIIKETAGDFDAARSGTLQWLLCTEVGRWRDEGVANAHKVLQGAMACVPEDSGVIVLESTANGASGSFYEFWMGDQETGRPGAVTLEQFKAGERGNGFIKCFRAWFEFPDSSINLTESQKEKLEADLDDDEKELQRVYGCTLGQVAYRRSKVAGECGGDPDLFEQEYPRSPETAFLLSGRTRFNSQGIAFLKRQAQTNKPDYGTINVVNDDGLERFNWEPQSDKDAEFHRWEQPLEGRRYILGIDTMTGASQAMGLDPDCHSVICIRRGFYDQRGWHKPKVAARIYPGCRWDIDVLEDAVYRLSSYYGRCLIASEINNDRGLIELLKLRGTMQIYRRKVTNKKTGKATDAYGWMTTQQTRKNIEEAVAQVTREWDKDGDGIELMCPHIVRELETFIVNERTGRAEAASGSHDDDVIALGIGLCTLGGATAYYETRESDFIAPDIQQDFDRDFPRPGRRTGRKLRA